MVADFFCCPIITELYSCCHKTTHIFPNRVKFLQRTCSFCVSSAGPTLPHTDMNPFIQIHIYVKNH